MERRYVCRECGVKWFLAAEAAEEPDLTECEACGGELVPLNPMPPSGDNED